MKKRRERFASAAKFTKDWVGFPAAIITAIAALIIPARDNILSLLGCDDARIAFETLRWDTLNVGLDDTPVSEHRDKIVIHIPFLRSLLVNDGLSLATVLPDFKCSANNPNFETITGHFYFIDINTQKKILEDIQLAPSESMFVNVALRNAGSKDDGYVPTTELNTCELSYSDKYGDKTLIMRYDEDDNEHGLFPMTIGGASDSRIAERDRYCVDMIKGISLGGEPIDCVSDTHVFAIEPVYLWERALARALKQTSEFRQSTRETAERIPGLILKGCSEQNCTQAAEEMKNALRDFTPSITVWLCAPSETNLRKCTELEFPRTSP